jgi:protease I
MAERKVIGVLVENRFIDHEIIYYQHRFAEEGYEVRFLTRLWGQPSLTFSGMELGMKLHVDASFENLSDADLAAFAAVIVPAGYVADMLRYAEKPGDIAPAVAFVKRVMATPEILTCAICHSLWIFDPIPDVIAGRRVTCHNNIIGSVRNTGASYVDQDVVLDGNLLTVRTGGMFAKLARALIERLGSAQRGA